MIKVTDKFWLEVPEYLKGRITTSEEDIRDFLKQTITSGVVCRRISNRISHYYEIFFEDSRQELFFKVKYSDYIVKSHTCN